MRKKSETEIALSDIIGKWVPFDRLGKIKILAVAEWYCMYRRPGAIPGISSTKAMALTLAMAGSI